VPLDNQGAEGATPSTILVVEPDILVRMVIASYLRECGYKILEGVSAADVIATMDGGHKVDTVFSEVRLNGELGGFELACWIREHHPGVDVILTTSVNRTADQAGSLCEEGPLEKPYHPQEIVRRINLLKEGRRAASSS
jgi:CheY-like chemotaxis protein